MLLILIASIDELQESLQGNVLGGGGVGEGWGGRGRGKGEREGGKRGRGRETHSSIPKPGGLSYVFYCSN